MVAGELIARAKLQVQARAGWRASSDNGVPRISIRGEVVLVTDRGRVVAELRPSGAGERSIAPEDLRSRRRGVRSAELDPPPKVTYGHAVCPRYASKRAP